MVYNQENCYFFASLIQQYLGKKYGGVFEAGGLPHPDLGEDIRMKVRQRMTLISEFESRLSVSAVTITPLELVCAQHLVF